MSSKINDVSHFAVQELLTFGIKQRLYDTDVAKVYLGKNPTLCYVKMANEDQAA